MRRILAIAAISFVVSACQTAESPLDRDVRRICECEKTSGALDLPEEQRMFHIAQWLGANIESQEGRQFLAELGKTADPKAKAALLTAKAKRHGLDDCPLAHTWETHAAAPAQN